MQHLALLLAHEHDHALEDTVAAHLRPAGFRVIAASSPQKVRSIAANFRIDLVLATRDVPELVDTSDQMQPGAPRVILADDHDGALVGDAFCVLPRSRVAHLPGIASLAMRDAALSSSARQLRTP